jgi:hypothetical protein
MTSERDQVTEVGAGASGVIGEGPILRRTAAGWSVGDEDLPDLTCAMVLADLIAAELPDSGTGPSGRLPAADADSADDAPGRADRAGPADPAAATGTGRQDGPGSGGDATAAGSTAAAGAGTAAAGAGTAVAESAGSGSAGDAAIGADGSHEEAQRLRITVGQLERALAVRIRVEQAIGVLAERHRVRPRQAFEQLRSAARARGQRVIDIAGDVIASATNPLLPLPEELSRPNLVQRQRAGNRRRARESQ